MGIRIQFDGRVRDHRIVQVAAEIDQEVAISWSDAYLLPKEATTQERINSTRRITLSVADLASIVAAAKEQQSGP